MTSMRERAKNVLAIMLIVCVSITFMPMMSGNSSASAATVTEADKYVAQALKYKDKTESQMIKAGKKSSAGPLKPNLWCAWFVKFVSDKANLKTPVYASKHYNVVHQLVEKQVNGKRSKLTFIDKTKYKAEKKYYKKNCVYNKSYKPRKGDLILYVEQKDFKRRNYTHIGIVRANCSSPTKKVKTIEGNTSNRRVKCKTVYSSKTWKIVGYVTPDYRTIACSHYYSYNPNGGVGTPSAFSVMDNQLFTVSPSIPSRSGYSFQGWNVYRSDGKYHCAGQGWFTQSEINAYRYTKSIYTPGAQHYCDYSWTKYCSIPTASYSFIAVWARNSSVKSMSEKSVPKEETPVIDEEINIDDPTNEETNIDNPGDEETNIDNPEM